MSRKTEESYVSIFKYIEEKIFSLEAASFTTDYEVAMRNAIKRIYEDAILVSCWFHYSQALRRKCSKINTFFFHAARNETLNRIFHKFLAIPLLPPNKIKEAFALLKLALECIEPRKPLTEFIKYFEKQWLRKVNIVNICHIYCIFNTH